MPWRRWLLLLILPLVSTGCDNRALEQRVREIKEFTTKEDRAFTAEALIQIQHKYWTLHDHVWYGKLPDSTIIQLTEPHVLLAPLPSRAFYRGWHLQMTIVSDDWRTYPASPHKEPFAAIYAITRHSPTSWDIRVTNGQPTSPLHHEDGMRVMAEQ